MACSTTKPFVEIEPITVFIPEKPVLYKVKFVDAEGGAFLSYDELKKLIKNIERMKSDRLVLINRIDFLIDSNDNFVRE